MSGRCFGYLLFACVAGCVSSGSSRAGTEDDRRAISAREASVIRRLDFHPIVLSEDRNVALSPSSPVIERDGRRVVVAGFRLPAEGGRMNIAVRTPVQHVREGRAVFFPDVIWLDEDFTELGRIPVERFVLRSAASGDTLTGDAFADAGPGAARYLLVTERNVSPEELPIVQTTTTGTIPIIVPMPGGVFMWNIPTGSTAAPDRLLASPSGSVVVRIERSRYRRLEPPVAPVFETVR